jgi:cell wall-associated NlpC family hydrolase
MKVIVPPPPKSARQKFLDFVKGQVGKPTLWGAKGPLAFDCSGLVTCGILIAGGPDLRSTHNANRLAKETRPLLGAEKPLPGDLIFFDAERDGLDEHVGVVVDATTAIDAEGARSKVTTLEQAQALGAQVRTHDRLAYRRSFRAIHRNTFVDSIDFVTL